MAEIMIFIFKMGLVIFCAIATIAFILIIPTFCIKGMEIFTHYKFLISISLLAIMLLSWFGFALVLLNGSCAFPYGDAIRKEMVTFSKYLFRNYN